MISIIVPCYNQAPFLDECLQSVLEQTYENWECIIVNDGSLDNTEGVAKSWTEKNARFTYLKKENGGVSSARNFALKIAKGNFIQFLDADDLLEKDKFEKSLARTTECDLIFTEFKMLTNKKYHEGYNKLKTEYFNFDAVLMNWNTKFTIPIHTALISKELIRNFSFDTSLLCFEDWLMWLHLFHKNPKVGFVDEPLAIYRKEESVITASSNRDKVWAQEMLALPKIKILYGDELHDELCYHLIRTRTVQNSSLKKELIKIQKEKIISKYLKLKKFYYKKIQK